jgi:hypothetical protein
MPWYLDIAVVCSVIYLVYAFFRIFLEMLASGIDEEVEK